MKVSTHLLALAFSDETETRQPPQASGTRVVVVLGSVQGVDRCGLASCKFLVDRGNVIP